MALGLVGGLPVAGLSKLGGLSGLGLSSSISSFIAGANPAIGALQAVSSLFGGGKVKISSAQSQTENSGNSTSGLTDFFAKNKFSLGGSIVDFSNPSHFILAAAGVVGVVYLIKKMR